MEPQAKLKKYRTILVVKLLKWRLNDWYKQVNWIREHLEGMVWYMCLMDELVMFVKWDRDVKVKNIVFSDIPQEEI